MLHVGTRTTIVLELSEPIQHLQEVPSDSAVVVFEAGPIMTKVRTQDLTPATTDVAASLVTGVRVQEVVRTDGMRYVRLQVKLGGAAAHQGRSAGSRLYVDFTAPPTQLASAASPALPAPPATTPQVAGRPPNPAQIPPAATSKPSATSPLIDAPQLAPKTDPAPVKAEAAPARDEGAPQQGQQAANRPPADQAKIDSAYEQLQATSLRRGRDLASRPDVRALLRLQHEVQNRDKVLGHQRADLVRDLLNELVRLTDEARSLQLERDRGNLLKER
jgi:hypothetical protein